jgi:hypothetical protein
LVTKLPETETGEFAPERLKDIEGEEVMPRLVNEEPPLDPVNGKDTVVVFIIDGVPIVGT